MPMPTVMNECNEIAGSMHECASLPSSGVQINFGQVIRGRIANWYLHLVREATDADLEESSYLEQVGDPIWSLDAEISYCPYCGQKLLAPGGFDNEPTGGDNDSRKLGHFSLFDQEKWSGRLR